MGLERPRSDLAEPKRTVAHRDLWTADHIHLDAIPHSRQDCPMTPKKAAPKMRPDVNETAYRVMLEATGQAPKTDPAMKAKNPDAMARGSKGGKKGGKARAINLTAEQRTEAARIASAARWRKGEQKD